jgi:hypothetical protein
MTGLVLMNRNSGILLYCQKTAPSEQHQVTERREETSLVVIFLPFIICAIGGDGVVDSLQACFYGAIVFGVVHFFAKRFVGKS